MAAAPGWAATPDAGEPREQPGDLRQEPADDAVIHLKTKALGYGQTYYVIVDSGAIRPPGGGTLAITASTTWRFTTGTAAPSNVSALGRPDLR